MGKCWSGPRAHSSRSEPYRRAPEAPRRRSCPATTLADPRVVDKLVVEMLGMIATYYDNEGPPLSLIRLQAIADCEEGWILVLQSLVDVVPLNDPFSMSCIALMLEDCPLPSRETVERVSRMFNLSAERALNPNMNVRLERNICVVLGCIAQKLAGPNSMLVLTDDNLDYLVTLLGCNEPCVVVYAIIALEKFAATSENQMRISEQLSRSGRHALAALERHAGSERPDWRQVGFCAQWALDNVFVIPGRELSYCRADLGGVRAMLNARDASENLKISSDGLEARCDSHSFESVRSTYQADKGVWYYECTVITPGVMQIGWATKHSHFLNHEGYGIGDDLYSSAFDGCRRLIWHESTTSSTEPVRKWQAGDILGCLLDVDRRRVLYTLNGEVVGDGYQTFNSKMTCNSSFFAAASFMTFQHCRFNFGREPFRHPPDAPFRCFNDHGCLTDEEKQVIPRRIMMERLLASRVDDDACSLCCDAPATRYVEPCGHRGFCSECVLMLSSCPLCRQPIENVGVEGDAQPSPGAGDAQSPGGGEGEPGPSGIK